MIPVNVTIQFMRDSAKESQRIKLAMETPVRDAVRELVQEFDLPTSEDGQTIQYHLLRQRQMLDTEVSLLNAGIQENDILQLVALDPRATLGQSISGALLSRLGGRTGSEPLPLQAALVHLNGDIFVRLRHTRALIGRADPAIGYPPESLDADLTTLDPDRTVSRPHAMIVYSEGEFTVRDLYSPAGVFVNGMQISPSKTELIRNGDVLKFGSVQLRFRCATG
jgi:hypothetical protein